MHELQMGPLVFGNRFQPDARSGKCRVILIDSYERARASEPLGRFE